MKVRQWRTLVWTFISKQHRGVSRNCSQRAVRVSLGLLCTEPAVRSCLIVADTSSLFGGGGSRSQGVALVALCPSSLGLCDFQVAFLWAITLWVASLVDLRAQGAHCLSHSPFHARLTFYNTFVNTCCGLGGLWEALRCSLHGSWSRKAYRLLRGRPHSQLFPPSCPPLLHILAAISLGQILVVQCYSDDRCHDLEKPHLVPGMCWVPYYIVLSPISSEGGTVPYFTGEKTGPRGIR